MTPFLRLLMLLRLMDAIRREKPALWIEIREFAAKREKGALEEFLLLDEFLPVTVVAKGESRSAGG